MSVGTITARIFVCRTCACDVILPLNSDNDELVIARRCRSCYERIVAGEVLVPHFDDDDGVRGGQGRSDASVQFSGSVVAIVFLVATLAALAGWGLHHFIAP